MERQLPITSKIHILKRLRDIYFADPRFVMMPLAEQRAKWLAIVGAVLKQPQEDGS